MNLCEFTPTKKYNVLFYSWIAFNAYIGHKYVTRMDGINKFEHGCRYQYIFLHCTCQLVIINYLR